MATMVFWIWGISYTLLFVIRNNPSVSPVFLQASSLTAICAIILMAIRLESKSIRSESVIVMALFSIIALGIISFGRHDYSASPLIFLIPVIAMPIVGWASDELSNG